MTRAAACCRPFAAISPPASCARSAATATRAQTAPLRSAHDSANVAVVHAVHTASARSRGGAAAAAVGPQAASCAEKSAPPAAALAAAAKPEASAALTPATLREMSPARGTRKGGAWRPLRRARTAGCDGARKCDALQGICGTPTDTLSVAVVVGGADGGFRPRPKPRPSASTTAQTTPAKTATAAARGEHSRAGATAAAAASWALQEGNGGAKADPWSPPPRPRARASPRASQQPRTCLLAQRSGPSRRRTLLRRVAREISTQHRRQGTRAAKKRERSTWLTNVAGGSTSYRASKCRRAHVIDCRDVATRRQPFFARHGIENARAKKRTGQQLRASDVAAGPPPGGRAGATPLPGRGMLKALLIARKGPVG